ncbi:hypothetical protein BD410DRAFT_715808 [Rickenella mellea]|uniref:Protein kinase domain-containing protein n=1 Tax=Rickenella mellea TaxID=50990 RepID=A0A4Y7QI24_9AGAM|nr:hypothetical protein BD410DRAFT_715808 [Rickenella mellea]
MRYSNPEDVDEVQRNTRKGKYALAPYEVWWRDREEILDRHGYVLRKRFRKGWVPTWLGNDLRPFSCEDAHNAFRPGIIDATRKSDGVTVILKKIPSNTSELANTKFFSLPELRGDSRNHCVPILDDFALDLEPELHIIVLPHLRPFDDPRFEIVSEVLNFIEQTLEGTIFMHEKNVAHRDLAGLNIMLDGTPMFPEGYHPTEQALDINARRFAKRLRRADVSSVKYYFIDFGLSTRFDDPAEPRLVTGNVAQDPDVPELSVVDPYDPFLVDIFTLGNVYRNYFLQQYSNLEFLLPLVTAMTHLHPQERPSAVEAMEQFRTIASTRKFRHLRWRLRPRTESRMSAIVNDVEHLFTESAHIYRVFRGVPKVYSEPLPPL